jgi:hypothetical protein
MFRMVTASVLYLALLPGANAQDIGALLTGEMRGLVVHDDPQCRPPTCRSCASTEPKAASATTRDATSS